jgi:general secretion pathway protein G
MKTMKAQNLHRRRARRGFTLLEMVIVLGIIAVIIGGAVTVMQNVGEGAKLHAVNYDLNHH